MDVTTGRVGIAAGTGLVGRFGGTVVLVAQADDGSAELFDLVEDIAAGDEPGATVANRLAGWIVGRPPGDATAFGVVSPLPDGVVVFLRGAVWAEVGEPDGTRRLSGQEALTWVDRVVPRSVERVAVGCSADLSLIVHPRSDLREGVVPGGGFVVLTAAAAADESASVKVETDGAVSAEVAAGGTAPALAELSRPEPATNSVASRGSAAHPMPPVSGRQRDRPEPLAEAVTPAADSPSAAAPAAAGPSLARPTMAVPIAVGRLTSETGPTIVLDRAYVLGREPQNDPAVRSGAATPIVVHDPDNLISRVHAYLAVEGKAVIVRDAGSVSGTHVAAPGAQEWSPITADPSQLSPGWSLRVGRHVFVFQPARSSDAG